MNLLNARSLTVKKDGTTIDCAVFGTGSRALVLIPGLSFQRVKGAAFPLAYMYRIFSKEYTVYVIDKKDAVPDGYTIRELADDTAFVMEQFNLRAADVFGVSQGGMIAQYLAINYPHLVRKLVLGVTASRQNGTMEEAVTSWIRMAEQRSYETFVIDMFEKMYSEKYIRKYRWLFPILSKIGKPKDVSRFTALAEACLTCNAYPELHKITCPVFVIGGKRDHVVTGAASEEIATELKCKIYMYDTLGHGAYDEAPDFNARIYQFLSE
ncbi:MAG: alpha/beta hydrolase [Oscillospiraceae bacterium]|nr:alpha/beta hydrolase [Oscillospiraceae bacterium]